MQITENDRQYMNGLPPAGDTPLTVDEYADINYEIEDQPAWRAVADKEMDYADGNQARHRPAASPAGAGHPARGRRPDWPGPAVPARLRGRHSHRLARDAER